MMTDPDVPVCFDQVIQDECAALRPDGDTQPQSALCISGGGIRSATFALGVIQSLADHGLLDHFEYLSTVSGGGYIGSWLTSWIKRQGGIDQVILICAGVRNRRRKARAIQSTTFANTTIT